jgi:hypothetical protein
MYLVIDPKLDELVDVGGELCDCGGLLVVFGRKSIDLEGFIILNLFGAGAVEHQNIADLSMQLHVTSVHLGNLRPVAVDRRILRVG